MVPLPLSNSWLENSFPLQLFGEAIIPPPSPDYSPPKAQKMLFPKIQGGKGSLGERGH